MYQEYQVVNPKNDPRFGRWPIQLKDHKSELYRSIQEEGSEHIGRDPDFPTTVAELVIGLMIMSMRNLGEFYLNQKNKKWEHKQSKTVNKKRIGIIGNGVTGGKVKEFITTFYTLSEVYSFSKHGKNESFTIDKFDALLPKLDIIIIIVPPTPQTLNLFNADRIRKMKD